MSLNQIAKHLGLTDRTLQRQLANEKTTFQILLSESRQAKAKTLLKNKLSIQEISNLLGYNVIIIIIAYNPYYVK